MFIILYIIKKTHKVKEVMTTHNFSVLLLSGRSVILLLQSGDHITLCCRLASVVMIDEIIST